MLQKRMLILAAVILLIAISVPAQKVVEKKRLGPIQRDVWLVRLDSTGNVLWQTRFGHKESNFLKAVELPDGELFLTGFSDSCKGVSPSNGFWTATLSCSGKVEEQRCWDPGTDKCTSANLPTLSAEPVLSFKDGTALLLGARTCRDPIGTPSGNESKVWMARVRPDGAMMWHGTYTAAVAGNTGSWAIFAGQTQDSGFVLAGSVEMSLDPPQVERKRWRHDIWLLRTDAEGRELWQRTLEGNGVEGYIGATVTRAGEIILTGSACPFDTTTGERPFEPRREDWIAKFDPQGKLLWQKRYGGDTWMGFGPVRETREGTLLVEEWMKSGNRIYRRTLYRIGENGDTSGTIPLGDFSPAVMTALDENGNWFGAQYAPEFKFFRYDRRHGKMQEWPLPSVERGHFRYIDFLQSGYLLEGYIETLEMRREAAMPSKPLPKANRPKVDVEE